MSIIIFGDLFSFPEGLAATNRVYTYAKGFKENNVEVYVICFSNDYLDHPNGISDGITYYNPFQQKTRSGFFLVRRWQKVMKYVRTYSILRSINKKDKIIAINRWSDTTFTQFYAWLLSGVLGAKVITECNEHPLRYHQQGKVKRVVGKIKFYIDSSLSHGILCISRYLVNFHLDRGVKKRKLLLVPSTVDPGRFVGAGERVIDNFYIAYFGSLSIGRDNIDLLIKSFASFNTLNPTTNLVLGGFCSPVEKMKIDNIVHQLGIESKVKIIAYLTRSEILKYIIHADILVMVRAKDIESDASYPSKLTEFLATGRPVVSVNVGEVSDYLTDGINAYLVQPGNVEELAEKLTYIYNNYDAAKVVGIKGEELVHSVFNYNYQAKRMIKFIQSLNN